MNSQRTHQTSAALPGTLLRVASIPLLPTLRRTRCSAAASIVLLVCLYSTAANSAQGSLLLDGDLKTSDSLFLTKIPATASSSSRISDAAFWEAQRLGYELALYGPRPRRLTKLDDVEDHPSSFSMGRSLALAATTQHLDRSRSASHLSASGRGGTGEASSGRARSSAAHRPVQSLWEPSDTHLAFNKVPPSRLANVTPRSSDRIPRQASHAHANRPPDDQLPRGPSGLPADLTPFAVPEPMSVVTWLVLAGALGFAAFRSR